MTWRSVRLGLAVGSFLSLSALAAHLPLRIVSAGIQQRFGDRFSDHFLGGLSSDLAFVLPLAAALWMVLFLAARAGRRVSGPRAAGALGLLVFLQGLLFALLALGGSAAAEFRAQRGLWPTWWDLDTSRGDAGIWTSSLRTFGMSRHLGPLLLSLALILLLHLAIFRALARRASAPALPLLSATLLPLLLLFGVSQIVYQQAARGLFPTVRDREADLSPPLRHLARSFGLVGDTINARLAAPAWLGDCTFTAQEYREGAALLGFSSSVSPAPGLRRPLPGEESPVPEAVALASALSRALFADSPAGISVLQVALESVRSADLGVPSPPNVPGFTPFLDSLQTRGHGLPVTVLAAGRMYQGGIRTSQAVAGFVCGLGSLPFQWSTARDFGSLPLRCLPDVLVNAGYRNTFMVGTSLAFDRMDLFFRTHATKPAGQEAFPPGTPRGAWGVTDRALLRAALAGALASGPGGPRWDFVLTMTNHGPANPPPDLPAAVVRRVDAILAQRGLSPPPEDRNRLLTLSYTDFALQEFLQGGFYARPGHERTLVVLHGDHATTDPLPGGGTGADPSRHFLPEAAQIPFLVLIPRSLLDEAADPAAAGAALDRLQSWLADHPLSGNDVPALLLALLGGSAPLRRLPAELRWHTMGGQATSPWFAVPWEPEAGTWGIDAFSRLFLIDVKGEPIGSREGEPPVSSREEVLRSRSRIRPIAAVIRGLLDDRGAGSPLGLVPGAATAGSLKP